MTKPAINPDVATFLWNEKVLIVEPSVPFAQSIVAFLKEFGMAATNIFHVRKYAEAQVAIKTHKPRILITEYSLESHNGISLISNLLEHYDETNKIAILITHDASSSTIAEAAEEHVDAYFLKPISITDFSERFGKTILSKIKATPFQLRIRAGKAHLKNRDFDKALNEFTEAKKFEGGSALPYYYLGQVFAAQGQTEKALSEYDLGLALNSNHFKCLLGKLDSLFESKNHPKSYEVGKIITQHFPISPKRLGNILVSAVFSHNLDDVAKYFEIYRALETRPPELTKIFSAALLTAGKHHLKANSVTKADQCFQMGVTVLGSDVAYLDAIIRELLKVRASSQAEAYLSLFPSQEVGMKTYCQLAFLISLQSRSNRDEILEKGKKLVAQDFGDKESYLQFVKFLVDVNKKTLAEDIATKAVKDYPELRKELYEMIEGQSASR